MKNFKELRPLLPYLFISGLIFFLLPIATSDEKLFRLLLFVFIPLYCLASSVFYGFKNGFHYFYPIFIGAIFLPIIFTLLECIAIIFAFFYGIISLLGVFIGSQIERRWSKK